MIEKKDLGKTRWDLIPYEPLTEVAEVLTYGNGDYGPESWKNNENFNPRFFAALMRHVVAWKKGELIDPTSGKSHLAHAMCNCLFLLWKEQKERAEEQK